jgi:hypothetical protein
MNSVRVQDPSGTPLYNRNGQTVAEAPAGTTLYVEDHPTLVRLGSWMVIAAQVPADTPGIPRGSYFVAPYAVGIEMSAPPGGHRQKPGRYPGYTVLPDGKIVLDTEVYRVPRPPQPAPRPQPQPQPQPQPSPPEPIISPGMALAGAIALVGGSILINYLLTRASVKAEGAEEGAHRNAFEMPSPTMGRARRGRLLRA